MYILIQFVTFSDMYKIGIYLYNKGIRKASASLPDRTLAILKQLNREVESMKPYLKYGNWYIPNCAIAFPTECEAWEYIMENS